MGFLSALADLVRRVESRLERQDGSRAGCSRCAEAEREAEANFWDHYARIVATLPEGARAKGRAGDREIDVLV